MINKQCGYTLLLYCRKFLYPRTSLS